MGFKRKKKTEYETSFINFLYNHYNEIKDKLNDKIINIEEFKKYDFTARDCDDDNSKEQVQRILTSFHNHTTKFFNTAQRIYLRDVYLYCDLLNITPNDMLLGDNSKIITSDNEYYYYVNEDFEETVKKIKHDGVTLFKNKKKEIIV